MGRKRKSVKTETEIKVDDVVNDEGEFSVNPELKKEKKSKVIMLIGLPGSGKSTWAAEYASKNDVVVLSTDGYIEEYAKQHGMSYSEAFRKVDFKTIEAKFNDDLQAAIFDGKNIIWDQTNLTKKSRKKKMARIPRKDYSIVAKKFVIPDEELVARINTRNQTGKVITAHLLDTMRQTAEYDLTDEGFDSIIE